MFRFNIQDGNAKLQGFYTTFLTVLTIRDFSHNLRLVQEFSLTVRLKALRAAAGMTQEEFAEFAHMDYKTYQHIEAGRRPSLRLCTIEKLCDAYGIQFWEFFHPDLPVLKVKLPRRISSSVHKPRKEKNRGAA